MFESSMQTQVSHAINNHNRRRPSGKVDQVDLAPPFHGVVGIQVGLKNSMPVFVIDDNNNTMIIIKSIAEDGGSTDRLIVDYFLITIK